jgi:hypothetical protein
MPTNITSVSGWVTPQTVATNDAISSTVWNNLAGDVAMLYGKPWFHVFYTADGTTSPFAASTSSHAGAQNFFNTSGTGGTIGTLQNSPSSGLGSFSISSGQIFFPTSSGTPVPGLYRITVQATCSTNSTNFQRAIIRPIGGSTVLSYHPGSWFQSSSSVGAIITATATIPVGYGTWATCDRFIVTGGTNAGTPNILALDSGSYGPNSSPPTYNTYCFVEYLGTSTGTF